MDPIFAKMVLDMAVALRQYSANLTAVTPEESQHAQECELRMTQFIRAFGWYSALRLGVPPGEVHPDRADAF